MAWSDYDNPSNIWSGFLRLTANGSGVISGAEDDGTYILIPISSTDPDAHGATGLANLNLEEAHATTGDARKVIYELMDTIYSYYNGIASGSEPGKLTVTKSSLIDTTTANQSNRTYTVTVTLDTGTIEVASE